jgi:hypothetical protein
MFLCFRVLPAGHLNSQISFLKHFMTISHSCDPGIYPPPPASLFPQVRAQIRQARIANQHHSRLALKRSFKQLYGGSHIGA